MNIITETVNAVSEKKYKCPYCESRIARKEMCHHIENRHEDIIPQGMSPMQVAFNTVNKKQENYGYCIMCHSYTKWNEDKARYDRLCGSKKCHDDYVKLCADRLKKAKGITKQEMLSDPAFQDKMLKNRSISGTYKFTDGGSIGYVGSYEKNFLEFMDKVLKIKSEDIEGPGPTIKYMYKGKEHFWITDYIYKPYNLVFDIKDGGSNPNNRDMKEYREKQDAKEKAIAKLGLYNYCRLTDNNFSQLLTIMLELKESLLEVDENNIKSFKPIIRINEDAIYSAINKYPVYIVLMHSGTGMSNVIKAVTGDEFSHACISFDPALETMYSFGSKCLGSTDLGLTSIGRLNDFFKKFKAHYATYVMYLNKDQYDRMKERLQFFINKEPELKYDFPSLIACALQIPTEFRKKYFCSRFVMDVIGAGIHIDKAPSLWTPQDITLLNNITKVNGGDDFRKYDPKVTKRNMNQIKKNKYDKIKLAEGVHYNINNIIMEGTFVSNKDIYYNKEKFDNGDINLCFVTGHSGSGKSTLAHTLENNNIEVYELDDVLANKLHFSLDNLKEYGPLIYTFFTGIGKKYYYTKEDIDNGEAKEISGNYDEQLTKDFVKYAISWAKSHKNKKYIIEGIWLYLYIEPSQLSNYAVYIKGTSRLKSDLRAAKRDSNEESKINDRVKGYIGRAKNFFTLEAKKSEATLKKWRQYFSSPLNESSKIILEQSNQSKLYHLSSHNLDGKTISPSIPNNFLTKNGYEENKTKRVCASTSIDGCLRALSKNLTGEKLYVHIADGNYNTYKPSLKEVPDSKITKEVWITKPVKLKCIGQIKVTKDRGEDGLQYTYGNHTAELYDWDYTWVNKINESSQDDTPLLYKKILETVLSEWGTGFNALPAVTQKPIYIVNKMQNNAFSDDDYDDIMKLDSIFESSLKSNIDKDYKPKGKKNLSSFKKIKATKQIIDQYKKQYSFLRHIDYNDNAYLWIDNDNNIIGVASVDNRHDYNWITAIEITKEYQGYGLGKAILDYAVKQMHGNALAVNKENKIAQKMYLDYGFKFDKKDKKDSQVHFMYLNKSVSEFSGIGYGDDYSLSKITVFQDDDNLDNETISQKIKEGEINVFKYIGSPETIVENMYYSIYNNSFDHDNYVKVYPEVCSKIDAIREVTEYTMKADIARLNETTIQLLSESFNLQIPQYENANFDCKQDINGVYIQNKLTTMRSKSRESFDQIPTEVKKLVNIGYI